MRWITLLRPDRQFRLILFQCAFLSFAVVSLATITPASAEKRIALVVGNSAYRNVPPLTNPANDAKLIADTLQSLGFDLVGGSAQLDLDKHAFEETVRHFGTLMQGADVGLFYYAGHGVQVRGANYLVPVSADPQREADVDFEMLDTALVMRQMEGAGTRLNLIILDACRNNPFGGRALRGSDRGLAQMRAPEGTLISFATQPGNVAMDGEEGNSPYTKALAQTVKRPGLGIFDVFNEVGLEVKKQTGGSQQPWVSSSPITGSFYFSGTPAAQAIPIAVAPPPAPIPAPQPLPPAPAPALAQPPNEAQQVWGTIQNTTSIAVLERFIHQFPGSFYSDIARARLEELQKNQTPATSSLMSVSTLEQSREPADQNDTPKVTRYPDKDAPGHDAKWLRDVGSVEDCETLCLSDSACAGYTYNIKQSVCFLKTAIGNLSTARDSTVTGIVNRLSASRSGGNDAGQSPPKVTRYPNMDAVGNDSPWVKGIATVDQCEYLCLNDEACAGYTYNVNKTTCIPKTAIGPLTATREPAVTGVIERHGRGFAPQAPTTADLRPSFDCLKAHAPGEKAICASQTLSRLDGELANRYRAWLDSHSGASASVSQRHQKEFLAARKKCGAITSCLEEIYRQRITDFPGQPQSRQFDEVPFQTHQSVGLAEEHRAIKIVGKPSFDCRKAKSETAQAICGSTHLIQLDLQLAKLFWAKMKKLKGSIAEEEKHRQLDWGVGRNQCGVDAACVEQSYQRRIAELGGKTTSLAPQAPVQKLQQVAIPQPSQAPPPPPKLESEQKPREEAPARPKGPIATVQQLPNPIRLIGQADQPCDVASATLARLRKTLSVSVPDGLTVQAEDLRSFMWKTNGEPPLGPAYLVLASDAPVRVQGTGFYALTPEAKAPFRIKQFLKDTRVIIPLHVKDAPQSGEVKIRPLVAGPLKISAAIIGYTQCGENPDPAPIAFDLTVEPGAPEIVIADRFELAKPDQIIASPDGTRRLEIYGPRYRLIDTATGARLADEVGKEPRFSPTGRFCSVNVENNFSVRDSIDGKSVRQRLSEDWRGEVELAWDDRDSFLISHDAAGEGEEDGSILNPLEEGDVADVGCCGREDIFSKFRIDLENNFAVSDIGPNGNGWKGASSLTIRASKEQERSAELSDSLFARLVVPYTAIERWETIDRLKFTNVLYSEDNEYTVALKPFVVRPIIVSKSNELGLHVNNDPLRVASRGLGKVNLSEAEVTLRRDLRLRASGVEINPGVPFLKPLLSALKKIEGGSKLSQGSIRESEPLAIGRAEGFRLTLFASEGGGDGFIEQYAHLDDSRRPGQFLDLDGLVSNCFFDNSQCGFSAELFFNRYLIIWPKGRSASAIYDIEERKLKAELDGLPSPDVIQRISLAKDLKTVVKLDTDGGFQVIALNPVQRDAEGHLTQDSTKVNVILSGRIVDDEVVVWTPSGQFDSTLEGASHLALRFPGRAGEYSLDQFHKLFHENDLLNRALAGEEFKPPVVKTFPPSINVKPAFTADSIAAKIDVVSDDPVEEFRIYQDGLMTNVMPVAGNAKAVEMSAKRLPSARWVAFLARGPSGLFAQPVTFDAGAFPGARRRVHIVSVGIDHYDDDTIQQLRFAGSDAARFLKALQDKAGTSVEIVSQTLLRDAEASRETILAKLNETIAKAAPGDSIILFIAGHGIQTADKNYYLATSATRKDDIPNTSLRWSDLSGALAKAHSRIAVFLDTCQSGAAGTDFFAPNDASVSALLDRAPSGILIFSASKGRELSEEAADHGGGLFTSAVLDALSKKETDRNHNGAIEASELYASVKRAVVEATQGRQTPWFARNDMVGDFVPF